MDEAAKSGPVEVAPGVNVPAGVLRFSYASSGGPGGQNVNKRETKALLRVRIGDLPVGEPVRLRLRRLGARWLTGEDELLIASDVHRSQERNRRECLERLRGLLVEAKRAPKVRKKTKPSRGARERRLKEKKRRGEIKKDRRPPE